MNFTHYMARAFKEALKAFEKKEVPVGAVVFDSNGSIVGKGYNQVEELSDATAHAEMIALTSAMATLDTKYLDDCTIAVTMEPCPMCAGALVNAKIGRLIFGAYDPRMGAAGTVLNITGCRELNHNPEVFGGIMEQQCSGLLQDFFRELSSTPSSEASH
ncbi:MAG: nucleoside deaminase [Chlorobiaceae bacterium]|nr:nucleoside deaminase [Chlorobiaceae bacterium]